MSKKASPGQRHSVITNLLFNIIIPTLILTKLSKAEYLGAHYSIVVALAFPIAFGIYDFIKVGKANLFSILGFISILLTGGISLLELDAKYIAIKEAAIPGIIGLAVLLSQYTRYPLIRTLLLNEEFINVQKIDASLEQRANRSDFNRALTRANYLVAASFFLSSALNYGLAKYLLVSPPGSEAYSAELGRMTALSFPVIALPCTLFMMASLYYLVSQIKKLTALELEEILHVK
ncbi:MFS transporter [Spongiibacter taiwanensis]|uniref:VC0807 family protein n=1 Tax=Spongiibacter taiwanensis TaxID=1748242 RepID=UPI002035A14A|nr:VC0807 family protein [Spongiibacter taiwanensis]USA43234.1 MFS transporter [Spongiibacter taiwanensis]